MPWFRNALRTAAPRQPRRFEHATVEILEARLCLGGLTAPPVDGSPFDTDSHVAAEVAPIDPAGTVAETSTTSTLEPSSDTTGRNDPAPATSAQPDAGNAAPTSSVDIFADASHDGSPGGGTAIVAAPVPSSDEAGTNGGGQVTTLRGTGAAGDGAPTSTAAAGLAAAEGLAAENDQMPSGGGAWWQASDEAVVVRYDFRDANGHVNQITAEQQEVAVAALDAWSEATDGQLVFVRDTTAADGDIVNLGVGDLAAHGGTSTADGTLGLGGGQLELAADGSVTVRGSAWLDVAETWDVEIGNGDPEDTFDFFTVMAHETGHVLGMDDSSTGYDGDIMNGVYTVERDVDAIEYAVRSGGFYTSPQYASALPDEITMRPMMGGFPQLSAAEVTTLLQRGSAATASNDAIIAVVDRGGRILGVHVEAGAQANLTTQEDLIFAIDGAVAKARTAAFFSNGDPANGTLAPLTSRLVQFLSQSTITQREVQSNPNDGLTVGGGLRTAAQVQNSTVYGPGTVAPIGLGGHFPPGVPFTPHVDLFGIEHTNRDSLISPGIDGIKGTADDIVLADRFNAAGVTTNPAIGLEAPESYGVESGLLPNAQARGIATLPGGIPLFRDTNGDRVGDTLVGGIGVFFPGTNGFADFEQNFQPGIGQTQLDRLNAPKVLEAEFIAFTAAGGSDLAVSQFGVAGAKVGDINGIARVPNLDMPFGRLDLVGLTLPVAGIIPGREGLVRLVNMRNDFNFGNVSGNAQPLAGGVFAKDGLSVAEGWLVNPTASADGLLSANDVQDIINDGIAQATRTRAAVRLPLSSQTRMVFAVTDNDGNVLGLFRMRDATVFSIDVAVAKARNASYYANPAELDPFDQVNGVPAGTAFSARTFRFLAEPRFPSGIDGTQPPQFSILNQPSIDHRTAENVGAPAVAGNFDPSVNPNTATVLGYDSFFPNNNFQDPDDPQNQNGVVFFPGSAPLYRNGQLIGGLGVSGDGVDQDDVVTFIASQNFRPTDPILKADEVFVRGVRLPYQKFLRNPTGNVFPFG